MARILYPSLQQPVGAGTDDTTNEARWHKQWADPRLDVKVVAQAFVARMASGQTFDPFPLGTPEFIGPDKWWQPFSQRLYSKPGLPAYLQQVLAYSESAQFPEVVYIDKYLYPFGLPVWYPKRLVTGAQPSIFPESRPIISIGWFMALSEPKRFPKAILAGDQPHYYAEPEPEDQDFMAWFRPFSEPKRFKPELNKALNPAFVTGAHALGNPYARAYVIC